MNTNPETDLDEDEIEEPEVECWCGAKGLFEDLFDDSVFGETCGGFGIIDCRCGGDICVCHHHGEIECTGCPDCLDDEYDEDEYDDDDSDAVHVPF